MPASRFLVHDIETVLLEHIHGRTGEVQEKVVGARGEPAQLQPFPGGRIVQFRLVDILPCGSCLVVESARGAEGSGAENAKISEHVEMADAYVQRLSASHGEAGHGAVASVRDDAVMALCIGHDVVQKILQEINT